MYDSSHPTIYERVIKIVYFVQAKVIKHRRRDNTSFTKQIIALGLAVCEKIKYNIWYLWQKSKSKPNLHNKKQIST